MANNYQSIASNFRKDPINNTIVSKPIIQPDVISPNSSGIVPMWEIPEVRNRVKVMNADGTYKVECFNAKDITEEKYFYVDYALGDCYFHKNELGKAITIAYRGIGNSSLYAGRVYTKLGEGGNVTETLNDIITKGRASIDFYNGTGSAITLLANLTAKNTEALATTSSLNTAISNGDIVTIKTNITNLQTLTSTQGTSITNLSTNKVNKTESGLNTTSKDVVTSINEVNTKVDTKQSSTDATLTTTSKDIVSAINELKTSLSITNTNIANNAQAKTDNSLATISKTVVGGINELKGNTTAIEYKSSVVLGADLSYTSGGLNSFKKENGKVSINANLTFGASGNNGIVNGTTLGTLPTELRSSGVIYITGVFTCKTPTEEFYFGMIAISTAGVVGAYLAGSTKTAYNSVSFNASYYV